MKTIKPFKLCASFCLPAILFAAVFVSCMKKEAAVQESGAITDSLGRKYVLGESPQRIVSLVPAVTEILFAIGAGEKVAGVTEYCDYPPEALARPSVGGFSGATISMEQIRVLRPDLVLLSADMHIRVVSLLDALDIPSFALEPFNFREVYETIALIGKLSGCDEKAEEVISEMKRKISGVEERIGGQEPVNVFWVLSEDPLITAGGETFVSEAISLGGGVNIFGDLKERWPSVSFEQVLLRNPRWIIFGNDLGDGALFLEKNPLWQKIPAVAEGRFTAVNADLFYRYGPRLADGVIAISEKLHPLGLLP